jgi:hypothetical protein
MMCLSNSSFGSFLYLQFYYWEWVSHVAAEGVPKKEGGIKVLVGLALPSQTVGPLLRTVKADLKSRPQKY